MRPMKIALYGGSFDPPHIAHQLVCLYILSTKPIDEVWLIPCYQHPFGKKSADFAHRLAMCTQAATDLAPRVKVCDIEADLPQPSYTLHTIEAIQARHPNYQFSWVIGEDIFPNLHRWYHFEELQKKISFLIIGREGFHSDAPISIKMPEVSSTHIRNQLFQGIKPHDLVPKKVLAYIEQQKLYQEKNDL